MSLRCPSALIFAPARTRHTFWLNRTTGAASPQNTVGVRSLEVAYFDRLFAFHTEKTRATRPRALMVLAIILSSALDTATIVHNRPTHKFKYSDKLST